MKETGSGFSFYFLVLINIIASVVGMSFFFICGSGFGGKFLVLHFYWSIRNGIQKLIFLQMDQFFWFFCWYMPRFVDFMSAWTKICKNCSSVFFFPPTSNLFGSLRAFLVCPLNVPVIYSQRIL